MVVCQFGCELHFSQKLDAPEGENFIPLAPNWTATGGLSVKDSRRFSANWSFRYLNDRPANENNSIVAEGYFVNDFNCNYRIYKQWSLGLIVENILDTQWNETQFATLTRLPNEPQQGIEDITFTPGTPFSIRGKLAVGF